MKGIQQRERCLLNQREMYKQQDQTTTWTYFSHKFQSFKIREHILLRNPIKPERLKRSQQALLCITQRMKMCVYGTTPIYAVCSLTAAVTAPYVLQMSVLIIHLHNCEFITVTIAPYSSIRRLQNTISQARVPQVYGPYFMTTRHHGMIVNFPSTILMLLAYTNSTL